MKAKMIKDLAEALPDPIPDDAMSFDELYEAISQEGHLSIKQVRRVINDKVQSGEWKRARGRDKATQNKYLYWLS
jgi:hypothetical protein